MNFPHLRAAWATYAAGAEARELAFSRAVDADAVAAAEATEAAAQERVYLAFYADTQTLNRLDTLRGLAMLQIRSLIA